MSAVGPTHAWDALICTSEPGPNFSQASSSRQSHHGSQPQVPSRNAQRSAGLTRINGLFRHGWLIAPAIVEEALTTLNF